MSLFAALRRLAAGGLLAAGSTVTSAADFGGADVGDAVFGDGVRSDLGAAPPLVEVRTVLADFFAVVAVGASTVAFPRVRAVDPRAAAAAFCFFAGAAVVAFTSPVFADAPRAFVGAGSVVFATFFAGVRAACSGFAVVRPAFSDAAALPREAVRSTVAEAIGWAALRTRVVRSVCPVSAGIPGGGLGAPGAVGVVPSSARDRRPNRARIPPIRPARAARSRATTAPFRQAQRRLAAPRQYVCPCRAAMRLANFQVTRVTVPRGRPTRVSARITAV